MAEALTGASRAAVQRNLAWMEARGLIREVTGQGRYRMWRATNRGLRAERHPSGNRVASVSIAPFRL
jgi:Fe2+ or Zn2+ uptake regulation protein